MQRKKPEADLRKAIIAKAVVDPSFRKKLFTKPEEIFGRKLTKTDIQGLERVKKFLPSLDNLLNNLAGEVLCGGGGGCGGLA